MLAQEGAWFFPPALRGKGRASRSLVLLRAVGAQSRGHLVMSGENSDGRDSETATGIQRTEAGDAAEHPDAQGSPQK